MKRFRLISIFLSFAIIFYIILNEDIFKRFMPRSVCMFHEQKLIDLHLISDAIIFISYTGIAYFLFLVYEKFKERMVPFKGFLWMYGGFIFLCGLTHAIGVLNIYATYYWIDGIIKLITAIFSLAVCISFVKAYKYIISIKSPEEYQKLADELKALTLVHNKAKNV